MNPLQRPRKQIKVTIVVFDESGKIIEEFHPDVSDMMTAYNLGRKLRDAHNGDDYDVIKRV